MQIVFESLVVILDHVGKILSCFSNFIRVNLAKNVAEQLLFTIDIPANVCMICLKLFVHML